MHTFSHFFRSACFFVQCCDRQKMNASLFCWLRMSMHQIVLHSCCCWFFFVNFFVLVSDRFANQKKKLHTHNTHTLACSSETKKRETELKHYETPIHFICILERHTHTHTNPTKNRPNEMEKRHTENAAVSTNKLQITWEKDG